MLAVLLSRDSVKSRHSSIVARTSSLCFVRIWARVFLSMLEKSSVRRPREEWVGAGSWSDVTSFIGLSSVMWPAGKFGVRLRQVISGVYWCTKNCSVLRTVVSATEFYTTSLTCNTGR